MHRIIAFLLVAVFFVALTASPADAGVRKWVNEERTELNRAPLKWAPKLVDDAKHHSRAMARTKALFHDTDALEATLDAEIPGWKIGGENLGLASDGPGVMRALFTAWMDSKPHRRNFLNGKFTHMSLGIIKRDGIVWVTAYLYG